MVVVDGVDYASLRLALWEDPGPRGEVTAWVEGRLAERGGRVLPVPPRVRVRPWSTTARFATTLGTVWFKAGAPGADFEAALAGALHAWAPGRVLTPIAVDAKRGWALLPDGGPPLVDLLGRSRDLSMWGSVLRAYAQLQRALVGRVRDMLALGVPDLRPARLGTLLDELLADRGVSAQLGPARTDVEAFRPEFERIRARLASSAVPPSLDHSDLNMGNVFLLEGGYRFVDWGDASVAHPFTSLLVPLRFAAAEYGASPAELERLRDAYLEPWSDTGSMPELRDEAQAALRLGPVSRALAWGRVFPELGPQVRRARDASMAAWLRTLATGDLGVPFRDA